MSLRAHAQQTPNCVQTRQSKSPKHARLFSLCDACQFMAILAATPETLGTHHHAPQGASRSDLHALQEAAYRHS